MILGTKTNVSWLRRVITHPAFREGLVSTRFIPEHEETLRRDVPEVAAMIATAIAGVPRKRAAVSTEAGDSLGVGPDYLPRLSGARTRPATPQRISRVTT